MDFRGTERFRILSTLGEGGMGVVYEVLDRQRGSRMALKTLRAMTGDALHRFKHEFRTLSDLDHPNLVSLGELFEESGQWFFTMELVEGVDFLSYARPEDVGFDEERLRSTLRQLGQAVDALHRAGKVHRDIKPSNVRVTPEGRVVLLDFGLVAALDRDATGSDSGILGTPIYMAPEQALDSNVTSEADWYSVGAVLYECLTGVAPFEGTPLDVIMNKRLFEPPGAGTLCPGVPEDLDRLCQELLRIEPARRPAAADVLRRLGGGATAAAARSPTHAPPFVGRGEELAMLRSAFAETPQGKTVVALVRGESGVGKSTLVKAFAREVLATDLRAVVLRGRCYERESVPFRAFDGVVDALSRFMMRLDDADAAALLPLDASLLCQVFPVLRRVRTIARAPTHPREISDPQEHRTRVFAALRELFLRLCYRRPVVVLVDDLQWADRDSLALLSALLRPPDAPALLFVATARPQGTTAEAMEAFRVLADVRLIDLAGLPAAEAQQLASMLLHDLAGADVGSRAALIAQEAQGHPLFIDELARETITLGERAPRSPRLEDALWARIERLETPVRKLLELVSVAGGPVSLSIAAHAARTDPTALARRATTLRMGNLVRQGGADSDALEPYHDRVHESVRAHLGDAARRSLHESLALAYEASPHPDPEALATHWLGAGDRTRAGRHAVEAAQRASDALAFDRAARLYRQAIDLGAATGPKELHERLGTALANAGRLSEAAEAFIEASRGATAAEALQLKWRAAEQYLKSGHLDEGLDTLDTVLGHVGMTMPATPRAALARLLWNRGRIWLRGTRFRRRDESQIAPELLTKIDTCWSIASVLGLIDEIRGAYFQARHLVLALDAGEPFRIARALSVEAAYSSADGSRGAARTAALLRSSQELAGEVGNPYIVAWTTGVAGMTAFLEGRWKDARESMARAEAMFQEMHVGVAWELTEMQWFLQWALAYLGEMTELTSRVTRRLREAEERGDYYAATCHCTGLVNMVWLASDEPERARSIEESAIRRWTQRAFQVQHWWDILAQRQIDLYVGDPAAHARILEQWPALSGSLLLRVQSARSESAHLRARCALLAAEAEPAGSPRRLQLLALAAKDARSLHREGATYATAFAHLLDASVARLRGQGDACLATLEVATRFLGQADMRLYAAACRRARGEVTGGDEGGAAVAEADGWMAAQGIKDPPRMAAMLAPGLVARR